MCYTIPLVATFVLHGLKKTGKVNNQRMAQLHLLLMGGSVMLLIDHLWRGELFLIGPNSMKDLLLGVTMTVGVIMIWWIMGWQMRRKEA
ncbi:MAG: hypothetical protein AB1352_02065 [Patescibacteria group bacterium]